jgi:transcriptional regulator of acetoin/glycerol metabolism
MPDGVSVPPRADPGPLALPAPQMRLDEVRRWYVGKVLEEMRGNKVHAAERLGIDRGTLHRMLRRWAMGGDVEE